MMAAFTSAASMGPVMVWIALGWSIGFALHSARTRHDHAHHR